MTSREPDGVLGGSEAPTRAAGSDPSVTSREPDGVLGGNKGPTGAAGSDPSVTDREPDGVLGGSEAPTRAEEPDGFLGEIKAPAKVNLSLKVLGRRPDGYRELYGLMARVGLYDQIGVYLVGGQGPDELVCENGIGKPFGDALYFDEAFRGPTNLALRAVGAFRDLTGFPPGPVRVELIKAIPKAAGLGGGSSDAAAVLRLLSRHREVTKVQLKAMAIGLGADVPFFLEDEPFCWAGGRGERLSPYFGPIPGCHAVLVNPGLELPTSEVFGQLGLTTELNGSISLIADSGQESADRQPSWGRNDLEAPAVSLCPTLALTRKAIFETDPPPVRAGLSGSGATYWAIYDQSYKAQRASASLEKQNFWVRLVPLGT